MYVLEGIRPSVSASGTPKHRFQDPEAPESELNDKNAAVLAKNFKPHRPQRAAQPGFGRGPELTPVSHAYQGAHFGRQDAPAKHNRRCGASQREHPQRNRWKRACKPYERTCFSQNQNERDVAEVDAKRHIPQTHERPTTGKQALHAL